MFAEDDRTGAFIHHHFGGDIDGHVQSFHRRDVFHDPSVKRCGKRRFDEARKQLTDEALAVTRADHDIAYWVGSTYALLGEKDIAFKWLNKAIRLGNQNKPYFEQDTNLDSLRSDPRFAELMTKMNNGD